MSFNYMHFCQRIRLDCTWRPSVAGMQGGFISSVTVTRDGGQCLVAVTYAENANRVYFVKNFNSKGE
jgi:hypothetical protein